MRTGITPFLGFLTLFAVACSGQHGMGQEPKLQEPTAVLKGTVRGIVFLPDGKQMVTCGQDGTIKFWDTKTWKVTKVHETKVAQWSLALSPDGSTLLTQAGNGSLWAMDVKSQKISVLFDDKRNERVISATFSADSKKLFVSRDDGRLLYCPIEIDKGDITHVTNFSVRLDQYHVHIFGLAEGGKSLIIAGTQLKGTSIVTSDDQFGLWDIEGKKVKKAIQVPKDIGGPGNTMCRVIKGDKVLFLQNFCAEIGVFDLTKNQALASIKAEKGPKPRSIRDVKPSPDGKTIAVGEFVSFEGERGLVRLIDLETRQVKRRLRSSLVPSWLAYSPDGNTLACGCFSVVHIFDLTPAKEK